MKSQLDYRLACVAMTAVMFALCGCLSLGILWARQYNAGMAMRIQKVEGKLADARRQLRYFETKCAEVHMPQNLARMAGDQLVVPEADQIVWVEPEAFPSRSTGPRNRAPYALSLELALLDTVPMRR